MLVRAVMRMPARVREQVPLAGRARAAAEHARGQAEPTPRRPVAQNPQEMPVQSPPERAEQNPLELAE